MAELQVQKIGLTNLVMALTNLPGHAPRPARLPALAPEKQAIRHRPVVEKPASLLALFATAGAVPVGSETSLHSALNSTSLNSTMSAGNGTTRAHNNTNILTTLSSRSLNGTSSASNQTTFLLNMTTHN
ncbi:hypothetical protein PspLS_02515 [Pyricularia sp. CBS 133598]|nr:hypothetical protein PspLS_02515 [Pyricularia sp. CBS 133598]